MKPRPAIAVWLTAAIALPVAAWALARWLEERGIVPLPFGDLRLVAAQAIAVLPLAWLLAGRLRYERRWGILAVLLAAAMTLAAPSWLGKLDRLGLLRLHDGYAWFLHLVRCAVLLIPALGFCYAARGSSPEPAPSRRFASAALCVLLAVLPTFVYAQHIAATLRLEAADYLAQQRLWRAWQRRQAARAIDGQAEPWRWQQVGQQIGEHVRRINDTAIAERSTASWEALPDLLALDQHEEAQRLLTKMPPAVALPYRLELARRERRWDEIVNLLQTPQQRPDFDLLAMAYRGQGDWPRAEALYRELLQSRPGEQAHWHYQLGRHYELAGRPRLATQEYQASLGGEHDLEAAAALRRLRMTTPTCLLGPGPTPASP